LTSPIGITETQGLYPNTLEWLAVFIQNATGDCAQGNKPKRDLVHLLPWRQGQVCSFTGGRQSSINLPRKSVAFHPQAIGPGRQLKREMAFHIGIGADWR
jgi:hypothetical protein